MEDFQSLGCTNRHRAGSAPFICLVTPRITPQNMKIDYTIRIFCSREPSIWPIHDLMFGRRFWMSYLYDRRSADHVFQDGLSIGLCTILLPVYTLLTYDLSVFLKHKWSRSRISVGGRGLLCEGLSRWRVAQRPARFRRVTPASMLRFLA